MSFFPQTIEAALAGRVVRCSFLVLFDFVTTPMRLWTGAGELPAGGHTWSGLGELGSITGIEQAIAGEAPAAQFILSGIDSEILSKARDEWESEAKDQPATVYIQFHNFEDDRPLELFDQPYAIWSGKMQTPSFDLRGADERKITVTAESRFALRSRPPFSQYTDRDQQQRFSGDLGFELVPSLINKIVTWPDF